LIPILTTHGSRRREPSFDFDARKLNTLAAVGLFVIEHVDALRQRACAPRIAYAGRPI